MRLKDVRASLYRGDATTHVYALCVDGAEVLETDSYNVGSSFDIWCRDIVAAKLLAQLRPRDLPAEIVLLGLDTAYGDDSEEELVVEMYKTEEVEEAVQAELAVVFRPDAWKRPYTIAEYLEVLQTEAQVHLAEGIVYQHSAEPSEPMAFRLSVSLDADAPIESALTRLQAARQALHERAMASLQPGATRSLVETFDLPEHLRIPCEQYLLYFSQFLRDLGVEATTDLRHEAGRVLFSVTPASGAEALQQIREALDVYLNLPAVSAFPEGGPFVDVAVQQLSAQVLHLRSQLILAGMTQQMQAATIQSQASTIANQQAALLSGAVLRNAARPALSVEASGDREAIVPGVNVVPVVKGGLELHLPELLRRLKRRFR